MFTHAPKNVAIKPSIEEATRGEKELDIETMAKTAFESSQLININDQWNDSEDVPGEACPFVFQE